MTIKRARNIYNYYHSTMVAYVISILVIYYFNIYQLNFNYILSSIILLDLISIALTIWYKLELKQNFERNNFLLFHYKNSKIVWTAVGVGFITIFVSKDVDSELSILIFSIGIYLLLSQAIEYFSGNYFKTNVLAFSDKYLIDLNGRIKIVQYKKIKSFKKDSGSISIQEKYEKHKIKQTYFQDTENMIEKIENELLTNVNNSIE